MEKKNLKRTEYVCTSISFSLEEKPRVHPLDIPTNNAILDYMQRKLKQGDVKRKPIRTKNLGVKFSLDRRDCFNQVQKTLKGLNIRFSNFYKDCYSEMYQKKLLKEEGIKSGTERPSKAD